MSIPKPPPKDPKVVNVVIPAGYLKAGKALMLEAAKQPKAAGKPH